MGKRYFVFENKSITPTTELVKSLDNKVKIYPLKSENTNLLVIDSKSVEDLYKALRVKTEVGLPDSQYGLFAELTKYAGKDLVARIRAGKYNN